MERRRLGTLLVGIGVSLLVLTATFGPVFAAGGSGPGGSGERPRTLVGVQSNWSYTTGGYVTLLDGQETAWRASDADTYFDVTRLQNGSVLAAFMRIEADDCGDLADGCSRTGYQIIDPSPSPSVVAEWSFPIQGHVASEVHDVEPLPGGGVVLVDMNGERVIVVRDGEVRWEWRATERYEPPANYRNRDWLHMNDVDRIGPGRFLVSVRNANQILVLERGQGVVEVINEDEEPGPPIRGDPDLIHEQHNPQWLGDGAVLVADSENHRIVELHRTANGSWERAWTLTGTDGKEFNWPRDADRLPDGTTLITDSRNARVVLVDENGTALWGKRFHYQTIPYEADRLPYGEPVGAPTYGDEPSPEGPGAVPVLTPGLRLLSAAVRLPFWFSELHLGATAVGVVATMAGVVVRLRS